MTRPVLYLVVSGAPLASRIGDGVREARARGWQPFVIPTEAASAWIDGQELRELDVPIVATHRQPNDEKQLPPADAVAVVPATFNTLTAWANGSANTFPLTILCAALGARLPLVAVPFAKHDLAGHPGWLASLAVLQYAGVIIVDPSTGKVGSAEPVASGTGGKVASAFQWAWVLEPLTSI